MKLPLGLDVSSQLEEAQADMKAIRQSLEQVTVLLQQILDELRKP